MKRGIRGGEVRGKKNGKEKFIFAILASCFLFFCFFFEGCSRPVAQAADEVCFGEECIQVEVVRKEEEMRRGLQFRESLDADGGMLFIFQKSGVHAFWMKDTLIPLDMVWMDYARRIVHIEEDVPPCEKDPCPSYTPSKEALYVLEVNAGYAARHRLKPGMAADFQLKEGQG
jgi:uncharacterized membrane protein (UPF0127 family)